MIILRNLRESDVFAFQKLLNDDSILRYYPENKPDTLDAAMKTLNKKIYVNSHFKFSLAIIEAFSGQLVGVIDCRFDSESSYVVNYFIGTAYQKKGYMAEALKQMELFIKTNHKTIKLLIFYIELDNTASIKVVEKFNCKLSKIPLTKTHYTYYKDI